MRRRAFIALLGGAAAWPLAARAQKPGRIYRLAMLTGAARTAPRVVAFFDELKALGFGEGQNLEIAVSGFDLRDDQLADAAAALSKAAPDVVFCVSDAATRATRASAPALPVVAMSTDLVAAGLVPSLARPGGNITGVSFFAAELNGKRLEMLADAVPSARRMAALADSITAAAQLEALQNAARARGVELAVFTADVPEQIAPAIDKAKASGAAALNVLAAPLFSYNRRIVIERAKAQGLPAIYEWPEMAEEGGLIGYGPRLTLVYRQAARLVAKILRGAKPGDLPVEQPTTFELVVNLKTAKALGLTIPESFLVRADKVIE
jgi:putative tryptophan/tyrosine transport system substrate-binding protein